jgi:2-dehydro-3-deoxyglucarate aldolase/4-hydroxy-2-oxoheptanedioate aldolase
MNTPLSSLIASDRSVLGTWISLGSPVVTELASEHGFDWLLLDLEHGCFTEAAVMENLRAVRFPGPAAIVRVPSLDPALIARVLDRGAQGVMVPHISSPDEARALVAATRYAPHGERGYSRTVRAYGYGLRIPEDAASFRCTVMAQIENLAGVDCVEEIAAVNGVDVLFVGPADLTHDLTVRGSANRYEESLLRVARAAKEHGKAAGILAHNPKDIPQLKEFGYRVFALDSDIGLLRKGYEITMQARDLLQDL